MFFSGGGAILFCTTIRARVRVNSRSNALPPPPLRPPRSGALLDHLLLPPPQLLLERLRQTNRDRRPPTPSNQAPDLPPRLRDHARPRPRPPLPAHEAR